MPKCDSILMTYVVGHAAGGMIKDLQTPRHRIVHYIVVCLVVKPLNRSEARVDFVVIQTLLRFICKSHFYHAN